MTILVTFIPVVTEWELVARSLIVSTVRRARPQLLHRATAWLVAAIWCTGWLAPIAANTGCDLECCSGTACPLPAAEAANPAECDGHGTKPGGGAASRHADLPDGQCGIGPCHQIDADQPWTFEAELARVPAPEAPAIRDSSPAEPPNGPDRLLAPPQPPPPQAA